MRWLNDANGNADMNKDINDDNENIARLIDVTRRDTSWHHDFR